MRRLALRDQAFLAQRIARFRAEWRGKRGPGGYDVLMDVWAWIRASKLLGGWLERGGAAGLAAEPDSHSTVLQACAARACQWPRWASSSGCMLQPNRPCPSACLARPHLPVTPAPCAATEAEQQKRLHASTKPAAPARFNASGSARASAQPGPLSLPGYVQPAAATVVDAPSAAARLSPAYLHDPRFFKSKAAEVAQGSQTAAERLQAAPQDAVVAAQAAAAEVQGRRCRAELRQQYGLRRGKVRAGPVGARAELRNNEQELPALALRFLLQKRRMSGRA